MKTQSMEKQQTPFFKEMASTENKQKTILKKNKMRSPALMPKPKN